MKKETGMLKEKGLKITPQRMAILGAVNRLNHPSCDEVIDYIRKNHPHIALGTVYKTLETFVQHGIIKRVKTESGSMRYDAILVHHHHLYSTENERIEDYYNEDLNNLIADFFQQNTIEGFQVEDVKLQIAGKFLATDK